MITNHTQLLNALIEKYNLKSYLEIGVQNPENNFDKINAEWKVGVDPAMLAHPKSGHAVHSTSDEYFEQRPDEATKFDLVFIDGLHTADQVKKDFENSLACLNDNGYILIHDVLPENEQGTRVPRETRQWWGDVYKWAMNIGQYENIGYKTFDIDNGCMLVWKNPGAKNDSGKDLQITYDWDLYKTMGRWLMNVTNTVEI